MSRPKRIRRMNNPPHFKGFMPMGMPNENHPVVFHFEEYEAIRLSDYELNGQLEASRIMGISRPTYSRIYESARRKLARAMVQGLTIVFEGGKVYFDSEWYECGKCHCWFNHFEKEREIGKCSLCGSSDIKQFKENTPIEHHEKLCICDGCGYEEVLTTNLTCTMKRCPVCNHMMMRKFMHANQEKI